MERIKEKTVAFIAALVDVYRDEEHRELDAFEKIDISEDVTEDFTAILIAMKHVYEAFTGDNDTDIIDFTHILNKLAIQYVMGGDDDPD